MNIKTYSSSEVNAWPYQAIELIATYEELYELPADSRVTVYFGDYGSHFFKDKMQSTSLERISDSFNKALDAIEMSEEEFFAHKNLFVFRGEIKKLMSEKMKEREQASGHKVTLWARLGVEIDVTPKELDLLKNGDEVAGKLLVELIRSDRIRLNGETYFPADPNAKYFQEDLEFCVDPQPVHKSSASLDAKIATAQHVSDDRVANKREFGKNIER